MEGGRKSRSSDKPWWGTTSPWYMVTLVAQSEKMQKRHKRGIKCTRFIRSEGCTNWQSKKDQKGIKRLKTADVLRFVSGFLWAYLVRSIRSIQAPLPRTPRTTSPADWSWRPLTRPITTSRDVAKWCRRASTQLPTMNVWRSSRARTACCGSCGSCCGSCWYMMIHMMIPYCYPSGSSFMII